MAKITAGVATSHVPAIGAALDTGKTQEPYWTPLFKGYEFSKQWMKENTPEPFPTIGMRRRRTSATAVRACSAAPQRLWCSLGREKIASPAGNGTRPSPCSITVTGTARPSPSSTR